MLTRLERLNSGTWLQNVALFSLLPWLVQYMMSETLTRRRRRSSSANTMRPGGVPDTSVQGEST